MDAEERAQWVRSVAHDVVVDEATRERQRKQSSAFGGILNLMTAFAAPRYLARADISKPVPQEEILGLFDDFVEIFDKAGSGDKSLRILDATRRMRTLLQAWPFGPIAPEPIVRTAREFMTAFGISEPEEGWDQWEAPPEEDPAPDE
jgi:hypothetical protein